MKYLNETPDRKEQLDLGWFGLLCVVVIFMMVPAFLGGAIAVGSIFLPLWGAILLGVPLGIAAFAIFCVGETTLMELGIKCFIYLILVIILVPVFQRAKQNARKAAKAHPQQTLSQNH